jgi:hypothetical protein
VETVKLQVREVHQTSGAFEHVVVFDAEILLVSDDPTVDVELVSAEPNSYADPELEKVALRCIREGILAVLGARGLGAIAHISSLWINPIDFVDRKFKEYTIRYLEKALDSTESKR